MEHSNQYILKYIFLLINLDREELKTFQSLLRHNFHYVLNYFAKIRNSKKKAKTPPIKQMYTYT